MPAQFSSYDQVEQPSLAGEMFGSPAKAWWTLQKGSLIMTGLSSSMWSNAMKGQGIKWGGVVGFRGIALGQRGGRAGIGLAKAFSPSHVVGGVFEGFDANYKASRFRAFGLFGKGGLLNKSGTEGISNTLGKIFGGGTFGATTRVNSEKLFIQNFMNNVSGAGGTVGTATRVEKIVAAGMFKGAKASKMKLTDYLLQSNKGAITLFEDAATAGNISREASYKAVQATIQQTERLVSAVEKGHSAVVLARLKNGTKINSLRRLARIGRFASWTMAASIAFDVGAALGGFAVNTFGNAADKLEKSLANITNRQMEFGGKVGIGFYSGASGTERQRALSVIGRSGGPGMGGEAGYQHVDSTW